jgi:hypothetical protein
MMSAQNGCVQLRLPHGIQGQRRGDYTGFNMSFEGKTIKQQKCKSCNIQIERKAAQCLLSVVSCP